MGWYGWDLSGSAAQLAVSQEGLSSMESVSDKYVFSEMLMVNRIIAMNSKIVVLT
jgi:hypothetical protein